jgi:hypothetical protein
MGGNGGRAGGDGEEAGGRRQETAQAPPEGAAARRDRLARALRQNLQRRKAQARSRRDDAGLDRPTAGGDGEGDPGTLGSPLPETKR